ncbi:hypothetical protein B0H17DRAFT_1329177 [Mycena rosella]|uniref:Uncharacterized protein n=1 Tax=Mycena rosella TaxID=1033263 RepID=A0AAD7GLF7_MYCRO|nr:hypothetical protein B0H17DRAFT_1329177 [Mycena rosella]
MQIIHRGLFLLRYIWPDDLPRTAFRCPKTIKALDDTAGESVASMSTTSISNTSFPFFTSVLPSTTGTNAVVATVIIGSVAVYVVRHASPTRLTEILLASLSDAEKLYYDAVEAGVLSSSDAQVGAMLLRLQREVSEIRETTLHNSLSRWTAFRDIFNGRSFMVFQCIEEVSRFKTHVEILKESRLRSLDAVSETWALYLRRRRTY